MPDCPVRIFVVDDHAVVRQGTREMLTRNPHFEVVGESACGDDLDGMIRLRQPDILLLDINLPGKNGLQLFEELKPQFPDLKIIFFSAHSEMQYIRKAQLLKADGYLSKTISDTELQDAILSVMAGRKDPALSADIAEKMSGAQGEPQNNFTARELEILVQVAQGLTNQGIAKNLCLSVKTVDTHVANLLKKSGQKKRTQLLTYAYEHGLI
ncbi:MAG TPA: response regulator transcription factor [Coleofasciculaceae cyanobacterium]|jgi:DNA-binding NarL/FixJ family response regulator